MESSGCSVTWDKLVENGQILTSMGHPAFPKIEAQHVLMKIGPKEPYTFCWECHRDFLRMVGDFIKLPEYVRNAELLARASPRSKKE